MKTRKRIPPAMWLYYLVCLLAMVWPGALIGNRIEPMVMGLPFFFFWYVLWVFVLFVGFVIEYWIEEHRNRTDG